MPNPVRWVALFTAAILAVVFLTGCWNLEEIENRAFVLGVGFDLTPEGQVQCTAQMPRPQALTFARGQSPASPQEQYVSITAVGATPWDALAQINKMVSRHLYLGHLQVIVIGEKMARQGIDPVIDGLQRYAVINRRAVVSLAQNPRAILEAPARGELTPAMYFHTFFSAKPTPESTESMPIWRVRHDLLMPAQAAEIPRVTLADGQFRLEGFGLFARGRLSAELSGGEARGLMMARGLARDGSFALKTGDRSVTVRAQKVGRRTTGAWWDEGQAHIRLELKVRGQI
ncbi:MAG: Ger(x)C family spore germination protein [Bacillota bacterium]